MPAKLVVIGIIVWEPDSDSTKSIITQLTNVIRFQKCDQVDGFYERFDSEHNVLYLLLQHDLTLTHDLWLRRLLTLFLTSNHIYWLFPRPRINIDSIRLLRSLQSLRTPLKELCKSLSPTLSFVCQSPSFPTDQLALRFRAHLDGSVRSLISPIASDPAPLFTVPMLKPMLVSPPIPKGKPSREQSAQLKRFHLIAPSIVQAVLSRPNSSLYNSIDAWRISSSTVHDVVSNKVPLVVPVMATVSRLFWDNLLPGIVDSAVRRYVDLCPSGSYGNDIHRVSSDDAIQYVHNSVPLHVFVQLEPALRLQIDAIWTRSGRRLCPAVSLTGRLCTHSFHRVPGAEVPPAYGDLMERCHSSGFSTMCSCNCGRTQQSLPDPFDIDDASKCGLSLPCCESSHIASSDEWHYHKSEGPPQGEVSFQEWHVLCDGGKKQEPIGIIFEFECDSGHRFIHNVHDPLAKYVTSAESIPYAYYPPQDVPLLLKCHECRYLTKTAIAHLRHIYVRASSTPPCFTPQIVIRYRRPAQPRQPNRRHANSRETDDNIDMIADMSLNGLALPPLTTVSIAIPLAFRSSRPGNRAFIPDSSHELALEQGVLYYPGRKSSSIIDNPDIFL
uniref:Nonsense-mediated mRNA decay factor SMG8 n=1 Tax=Spongospora subterranea TaxID=70186 RepID=A0A0H5RA94_9EUKA|eukprot:CRZ10716.1 hypothetical protein [Spongospora subterranea]